MTPEDNRYLIVVDEDTKDAPYNFICEYPDKHHVFHERLAGLQYFTGIVYPVNKDGEITGEALVEERVEDPYPSPGEYQQNDADGNVIL